MAIASDTILYTPIGCGLYNGTMGLSLINYLLWQQTNKPKFKKTAKLLLNETIEQIGQINNYTLNDGILGLGWSIEWLAENNFIKINANDFLADLDDEVYRLCVHTTTAQALNIDWFDIVFYLRKRLNTKNTPLPFYKKICLAECLRLIIDNICLAIIADDKTMYNGNAIAKGLLLLSTLKDVKVDTDNTTKQALEKYTLAITQKMVLAQVVPNDIVIAKAITTVAKRLNNKHLKTMANKLTRSLKKEDTLIDYGNAYNQLIQIDVIDKFNWKEAWFQ